MRAFEKGGNDDDPEEGKSPPSEEANVVTIRQAVHYVASDLPTVINGSWLGTMVSLGNLNLNI
jgi:hypothetical protein